MPFHDARLISHCVTAARSFGVKTLGIFGDWFDFHALSIFLSASVKDWENELDNNEKYGNQLTSQFDRVIWSNGNHEERMARALMQWITVDRLRMMIGLGAHVQTTDYYHAEIGDDWIATHPKNSSVIPGRVPFALAQKYRKNIISFHGHGTGAVFANGFYCIDAGMCADPEKLEYTQLRHNTRPLMQRGAVLMLKDSRGVFHPRLLNDLTDWELEIATGALWQASQKRNRKK